MNLNTEIGTPDFLSCQTNNGPWCAANWVFGNFWYIYNRDNGNLKKIGKFGAKRANYFDDAVNLADYRNHKLTGVWARDYTKIDSRLNSKGEEIKVE